MATMISGCLFLSGDDFDPDKITNALHISPTNTHRKDEIEFGCYIPVKKPYHDTAWEYEIAAKESYQIQDILDCILDKFCDKQQMIAALCDEKQLKALIYLTVDIEDGIVPDMTYSREFVSFAGNINAEIAISTYVTSLCPECDNCPYLLPPSLQRKSE